MGKLVVLKLNNTSNNQFFVTLEIGSEGRAPDTKISGNLPASIYLLEQYQEWQFNYHKLDHSFRLKDRLGSFLNHQADLNKDLMKVGVDDYIDKQKQECYKAASQLKRQLNQWLDFPGFRGIETRLRAALNPQENIRFLIRTESHQLRKLPWHLWNFLESYPKAEIALSAPEDQQLTSSKTPGNEVKILAILANSSGINVLKDQEELIEKLPTAKITFLESPQRQQLEDYLQEQPWDILFFAGHSRSEGKRGQIYINQKDSLRIEEISSALKKAIDAGLQLAIFNSCDGLGLASELEKLQIPQTIVMREAVPERVAQKFLTYFLPSFAQGATLYQAVRWARERLKGLEHEFPCATWLPVICQNPAVVPPTWSDLLGKKLSHLSFLSSGDEIAQRETQELQLGSNSRLKQTQGIKSISISKSPLTQEKKPSSRIIQETNQEKKQKNHKVGLVFLSVLGLVSSAIGTLFLLEDIRPSATFATSSPPELISSPNSSLNNPSQVTPQNDPITFYNQRNSRFSQVDGVPSGTFRYGGSTVWSTLGSQVHPAIKSVWPEFNLLELEHPTIAPSSTIAVQMLLYDHLHVAHTSRPLQPEEYQKAQLYGFKIKQIPVAIDGIAFAVNPELNLTGLTLTQLRDIYSGKITNWKQVGGPNLKIVPYSRSPQVSGTAEFFVSHVLDQEKLASNVKLVTNINRTLKKLTNNRGGIFYASAPEILSHCSVKPLPIGRTPERLIPPYQKPLLKPNSCGTQPHLVNQKAFLDASYPLTRKLYVIVKQNARIDEQAGVAYTKLLLSKEGQKLIQKAGFVPIH